VQNGKPRAWEVAETEEWSAKREKLRGMEEKLGKKARRLRSERHACLRRGKAEAVEAVLSRCQTERNRKAFWNAEQSDRHLASREGTRIASQALLPRESVVSPLRTGKGRR
jgi:hypothetical protein